MDSWKTAALWTTLATSVAASIGIIYLFFKSEKEHEIAPRQSSSTMSVNHVTAKVAVPKAVVGAVIGRQGENIKAIQKQTNTKINFEQVGTGEEESRTAVIRGSPSEVDEAQKRLNALIEDMSKIGTREILVPVKACGRIIGRSGDTIRNMCRISRAKIVVDRESDSRDPHGQTRVMITGTNEQIDAAVALIGEKLAEEDEFRQRMEVSASIRSLRNKSRTLALEDGTTNGNGDAEVILEREELIPTSPDGFIEVMVSSVEDPDRFWVQLFGKRSTQLDKMISDMTNYYTQESNAKQNALSLADVSIGTLLAAPFDDGSWYRAQVTAINPNEYTEKESKLTLFYVDFGDDGRISLSNVCVLRPEYGYATIPAQAIECCADGVKPLDGEKWSFAAVEFFIEATLASKWKPIMCKPLGTFERDQVQVYRVQIVDTNSERDIDVTREMIAQGMAIAAPSLSS